MRFYLSFIIYFVFNFNAFAAGGSGHGSPFDLIAPAFNVTILLGVLVWKLKGPLKNYFHSKSEEVANTLERASLKSKEAEMMLAAEERKIKNLHSEIEKIKEQARLDVQAYEKTISKENEEKIQKLKSDANAKIQADKKAIMDMLNSEILSQVISKTKNKIKANKEYQNKVSSKLLKGL